MIGITILYLAYVADVCKGKERGFWARGKPEGRAPPCVYLVLKTPVSLAFQTPATQAILYLDGECRNKNCLKERGGNDVQHEKKRKPYRDIE